MIPDMSLAHTYRSVLWQVHLLILQVASDDRDLNGRTYRSNRVPVVSIVWTYELLVDIMSRDVLFIF